MGNHNYLLGETLDLHSNRGERNPIPLSAWLIEGWSFYLWRFLKLLALLSSIWAARVCWGGQLWCSPAPWPCQAGYHTPLWQYLSPLPWSQSDHQGILYEQAEILGRKQRTFIFSEKQLTLSRRVRIPANSFLIISSPKWCLCIFILPKGEISARGSQRRWEGRFPWSVSENSEPGDDLSLARLTFPPFKHTSPGAGTASALAVKIMSVN